MNDKTKRILANCALLFCGAIWGGGFVVMKNALDSIPTNCLLALRFSIGALGLSFSLFNKKARITKALVWHSLWVGLLLYLAFAVQTYGLQFTTAGKNALLTGAYVVIVPILGWIAYKKRPGVRVFAAASFMLVGIMLLTVDKNAGALNVGDALTLLCALFYAIEMMAVERWGADVDVLQFSCLQLAFAAVIAFAVSGVCETFPRVWTADMYFAMAYCGIGATLVAITLMNVGLRYAAPSYAALLMSTESAFGCLFGVLILQEAITGRMLLGCILILAALTLSQLAPKRKAVEA